MPTRKPKPAASPKEREVARKPRKPRARKSADRPLRRTAASAPGLLAEMGRQARQRDRYAVRSASQGEPVRPLVMWRVYKHPKDYPGETWRGSSSSRKIFTGPTTSRLAHGR